MQFPSQTLRPVASRTLQEVRADTLRQLHDRINDRFDACRVKGTRLAWEYDPSCTTAPRAADRAFMPEVPGYMIGEKYATARG